MEQTKKMKFKLRNDGVCVMKYTHTAGHEDTVEWDGSKEFQQEGLLADGRVAVDFLYKPGLTSTLVVGMTFMRERSVPVTVVAPTDGSTMVVLARRAYEVDADYDVVFNDVIPALKELDSLVESH